MQRLTMQNIRHSWHEKTWHEKKLGTLIARKNKIKKDLTKNLGGRVHGGPPGRGSLDLNYLKT